MSELNSEVTKSDNSAEKKAQITLNDWQISYLLGAARLGIWAESWCAELVMSGIGTCDTHSGKWILRVGKIIDQVKEQTGISEEDTEYGSKSALDWVEKLVKSQSKKNDAYWEKQYIKERREDEERKKNTKGTEAEKEVEKKVVRVDITPQMVEEANSFCKAIHDQKR